MSEPTREQLIGFAQRSSDDAWLNGNTHTAEMFAAIVSALQPVEQAAVIEEAALPWRVAASVKPERLIAARERLERSIRQLVETHRVRRGWSGYDEFDGHMDWLMAQVSGAFCGIVDRATPNQPVDLGPHPNCSRCGGTGEAPNAQFRCPCRWSTSPTRPVDLSGAAVTQDDEQQKEI